MKRNRKKEKGIERSRGKGEKGKERKRKGKKNYTNPYVPLNNQIYDRRSSHFISLMSHLSDN